MKRFNKSRNYLRQRRVKDKKRLNNIPITLQEKL